MTTRIKTIVFHRCECGARSELKVAQAGTMRTCKECGCSEAIASFSELVELGLVRKKIPTPKHSVQFSVRQLLLATVPFALLASLVNKHGQGALVISILLLVYTAFVFLFALVVHNFDKLRGWIWDKRTPRRN